MYPILKEKDENNLNKSSLLVKLRLENQPKTGKLFSFRARRRIRGRQVWFGGKIHPYRDRIKVDV
jgi:hypothetical protein